MPFVFLFLGFFLQITELLLKWLAFQMIPHIFWHGQETEVNFSALWHFMKSNLGFNINSKNTYFFFFLMNWYMVVLLGAFHVLNFFNRSKFGVSDIKKMKRQMLASLWISYLFKNNIFHQFSDFSFWDQKTASLFPLTSATSATFWKNGLLVVDVSL